MSAKTEKIIALKEEAKKGYDRYKPQFKALEDGYLSRIDDTRLNSLKSRDKSAIAPQPIYAKVRKIEIAIMKTYFSSDEFAFLGIEDDEKLAAVLQARLKANTKRMRLYSIIRPNINSLLVYGTTAGKLWWKNGLRYKAVHLSNIMFDPHCENIHDVRYIVHRIYMTVAEIKHQFKKAKRWKSEDIIGKSYKDGMMQRQDQGSTIGDYTRIELYEVYRDMGDGKWSVSTLLGDEALRIDDALKDGHPFVFGVAYPQFVGIDENFAVRAYGGSFIAPMLPLQKEYVVRRNQQIDAIDLQLNPRFLSEKTSGLRDEDLKSNRKKITVANLGKIKEMAAPNINQSIFDTNKLDFEMQEISGVSRFSQGLNDSNLPQTATASVNLIQEGNDVTEDIITGANESFFEPLVERMVKLIYKYDDDDSLKEYERDKNIMLNTTINAGVGVVNKEIKQNNLDSAINVTANTMKYTMELGDIEKAHGLMALISDFTQEKAKLLGFRDVIKTIKDGEDAYRLQSEQGAIGAGGGIDGAGGVAGQGDAGAIGAVPSA